MLVVRPFSLAGDGRALRRCEGRTLVLIKGSSDPPQLVRVGIDAAIVAQHEVCIRATDAQGRVRTDRFRCSPHWPDCDH